MGECIYSEQLDRGKEELSGAVTSKLNTAITHRDFAFQKAYH